MNNYNRNHLQYDNLEDNEKQQFQIMQRNTSSFGDTFKNLPNIDDEMNDEDDESESDYGERMSRLVCSIDDAGGDDAAETEVKDQDILEAQRLEQKRNEKKTLNEANQNESSADENDEKFDDANTGKSHFFLSSKQETEPVMNSSNEQNEFNFTRLYENERVIDSLSNIVCLYSSNVMASESLKDVSSHAIKVKGKLMLTSFQLVFIPYENQIDSRIAQLDDSILSLFTNRLYPFSFVIPLTFIYEIRSSKLRF